MKKIIKGLCILTISIFVFNTKTEFVSANETQSQNIKVTVDGTTKDVSGVTKQVNGGDRNYVDLKDFCSKFPTVCSYTSGPITRQVKDTIGKNLFQIQITGTPYNVTGVDVVGRVKFNNNEYTRTSNTLEASAFQNNGKAYVPIRFFSEALGCYISGSSGAVTINSDYYRTQTLSKGFKLTFTDGSYSVSTDIPKDAKEMSVTLDKKYATTSRNKGWTVTSSSGGTVIYGWSNLKGYVYWSDTDPFSYTTTFIEGTSGLPSWIRVNVSYQ